MRTSKNRTDDTQSDIVLALRKAGAEWIPCSGDPKIAFDGLVLFRSEVFICEIKNGKLSPSQRKLTPREQARKAQVESRGVKYWILSCPEDALRMVGLVS